MKIIRKDPFTGKVNAWHMGNVTPEQMERFLKGEHVQKVFPHLTAEAREFILSGIAPDTWDNIFGVEKDIPEDGVDLSVRFVYFNRQWNVYINSLPRVDFPQEPFNITEVEREDKTGKYILREWHAEGLPFPIWNYGFWYYDEYKTRRPGHGGEWSSRTSIINEMFGSSIMEIGFDSWACAIDVEDMRKLLPEGATIEEKWMDWKPKREMFYHVVLPKSLGNSEFIHVVKFPKKS